MTLLFIQGHKYVSNSKVLKLYYNSHISDSILAIAFTPGMTVDWCMAYMRMLVLLTLALM